ncbi:MAG: alkane 1-monooxygenase [Betaproteobacteria bacterium]|nr:alkane 1-monooxygenase [Betaproteobacteria bacterium]
MAENSRLKLAGYPLCLCMPLLAPLSVWLHTPWLSPIVVFGLFPVLGLLIGEDRSPPVVGLRGSPLMVAYLDFLPRIYALVWMGTLAWAAGYAFRMNLSGAGLAALTVSVGFGSAVAICTAHELMHRRSQFDVLLARLMTALCLYGHMVVEHFHHHATVGEVAAGATSPRGMSIYHFAPADFLQGLRNAWTVERTRLRRCRVGWWHNRMLQDYAMALGLLLVFFASFGSAGLILFAGQAVFAVFCFEVITYVHHYGLVRGEGEAAGPQHAWAHHCWLTNCLTFNNTFQSDHHLRSGTPYYELHAMYGAPRLPANYFTMFCVALVPPLWRFLMDRRLDALAEARRDPKRELPDWLRSQRCR